MQIEQIGRLTEYTDSRAYIVHMSTAEGVDICKRYQEQGVNLHAETLPASLSHTYEQDDLGVWGRFRPRFAARRARRASGKGFETALSTTSAPITVRTNSSSRRRTRGNTAISGTRFPATTTVSSTSCP